MIRLQFLKTIYIFLSLLGLFSICYISIRAQSMCPLKTLKINKIQGKITAQERKNTIPLSYTKIDLQRLGDPDVLVTTVETDDKGFFEISNIPKGEYRLAVHFIVDGREIVPKYDVILKVKKSNVSESNKYICIFLAFDCGDNTAKVFKKKQ